jgi:hypothetical protein
MAMGEGDNEKGYSYDWDTFIAYYSRRTFFLVSLSSCPCVWIQLGAAFGASLPKYVIIVARPTEESFIVTALFSLLACPRHMRSN